MRHLHGLGTECLDYDTELRPKKRPYLQRRRSVRRTCDFQLMCVLEVWHAVCISCSESDIGFGIARMNCWDVPKASTPTATNQSSSLVDQEWLWVGDVWVWRPCYKKVSNCGDSLRDHRPGYHVCGSNKIIPVWKRNSQSGQGVQWVVSRLLY